MKIETERLELVALDCRQLRILVENISLLEKELKCVYKAEPLEGFFLETTKNQLVITEKDPRNYIWHSFWLIIRKSDKTVVGSADFKNVPNENGEVEIGYGLGEGFIGYGYMTETVKAMCEWAKQQAGVKSIIAETEKDGYASQNVLKRSGFNLYASGKTLWWRLKVA